MIIKYGYALPLSTQPSQDRVHSAWFGATRVMHRSEFPIFHDPSESANPCNSRILMRCQGILHAEYVLKCSPRPTVGHYIKIYSSFPKSKLLSFHHLPIIAADLSYFRRCYEKLTTLEGSLAEVVYRRRLLHFAKSAINVLVLTDSTSPGVNNS